MNCEKSIYEKAEFILSNRRISAENDAALRLENVCKISPEIAEINKQISKTIIDISTQILSKNKDVEENLARIKEKNLQGQFFIEKILVDNNLPKDYLKTKYLCSNCEDRGIVNGKYCSCFIDLVKKLSSENLNKSANLPNCDFEHFTLEYYRGKSTPDNKDCFEIMKKNLVICRDYAKNFDKNSPNLLLYGLTGLGKTHLSLSIAKEVIDKGFNVIYGSVVNLLSKIEAEHFGKVESSNTLELLREIDLLVLDDLGSEFYSAFYEASIYDILNSRINLGLPTIISSNLTISQLQNKYNDRIISRVFGSFDILHIVGTDIRMLKKNSAF